MKQRRINTDAMGDNARVHAVSLRRKVLWSLAWFAVSVPLTLVLTVPSTTPAAYLARAAARTQQLAPLLDASAPGAASVSTIASPLLSNDGRYSRYLLSRGVEREQNAEAHPWPRLLATFEILLLSMCIVPAWLAITGIAAKRSAAS